MLANEQRREQPRELGKLDCGRRRFAGRDDFEPAGDLRVRGK
jgi:hypothetical protein